MSDEIHISVSIPLDSDGFLRRECPNCEGEFKWFNHEDGDPEVVHVDQYFCPLCGVAAGVDAWWTPAQTEYATGSVGPEVDRAVQDAVAGAFKGVRGLQFTADRDFSLDIPAPEPLTEPDDMVIVEPPCHAYEPLKVPENAVARVYCLICGAPFAT